MGLDITAYRKLEQVPEHEVDPDECYTKGHVHVWNEEGWEDRHAPLVVGSCYTTSEPTLSFRAGAYSGYNWWRNELALLVHERPAEDVWNGVSEGPFVELINFSDCEGAIGPVVAAKLAKDFREWRGAAQQHQPATYFFQIYEKFQTAFEMAADGGVVRFH